MLQTIVIAATATWIVGEIRGSLRELKIIVNELAVKLNDHTVAAVKQNELIGRHETRLNDHQVRIVKIEDCHGISCKDTQ